MISPRRSSRLPLFLLLFLLPALALWQLRAMAAPGALVNLCSLPGALIDSGDLAYEGDDILVAGCQGEINGAHNFNSLTVESGSLLRHGDVMTMALTIATDVTVQTGAVIDVSGRGYAGGQAQNPGQGPGGGSTGDGPGGGGGHGGHGGGRRDFFGNYVQYGPAYGDVHRPVTLGSGGAGCSANAFCSGPGGAGGDGGGAIHLDVAGTLTIDGNILANGGSPSQVSGIIPGSGGAGGSIWLSAGTISGNGLIRANGGTSPGPRQIGGGGGRIALYFDNNSFSGTIQALGGQTDLPGGGNLDFAAGAGTIYLRDNGQSQGELRIINHPLAKALLPPIATTPLDGGLVTASEPHDYRYFDLAGSALVATSLPVTVSLGSHDFPGTWAIQGSFRGVTTTLGSNVALSVTSGTTQTIPLLTTAFAGPLTMDPAANLAVAQNAELNLREPLTVAELTVSGGARLGHLSYQDGISPTLTITANNITIAAGSQINVSARGFPRASTFACGNAGAGPGGGQSSQLIGAGAGHGGLGGGPNLAGFTYGSVEQPALFGSGGSNGCGGGGATLGPGGHGGGRVHLMVAGTLHVDGAILANGESPGTNYSRPGGGGSGGSIWLAASALTGNGTIQARGGHSGGPNYSDGRGGGGGGGRIALHVDSNNFGGSFNVAGGVSGNNSLHPPGGDGTIYPFDLFVANKSATPATAIAGQPLTYTIQLVNYGTVTLTARLTDTLPLTVTPLGSQSWTAIVPGGGTWTQEVVVTVNNNVSAPLVNRLDVSAAGQRRTFFLETPVNDSPITGLSVTNDSPTLDSLPVNFTASTSGGSGISYAWDFGDGATGTGRITDHVYPAPGIYTATVTASNSVNSLQASTVVTVSETPNFRGLVWHDIDGDGVQGPAEPGLNGAQVSATGPGGILSTSSGADGSWQIDSAVGGLYTLDVTLAGYVLATEPPPPIPLPAQGATLVNFGLSQPPPAGLGRITGRAFADLNGNGSADPGESGLAGVTIALQQGSNVVNTTVSDSDGFYQFAGAAPGLYQLRATAPAGYYPAQYSTADISLAAGQIAGIPFGFAGAGSIGGTVSSGGGYPVAGATVILLDENGAGLGTTATSANGSYTFPAVAPGTYSLRLLPPPEYLFADGQDTRPVTLPAFGAVTEDWTLLRQGRLRIQARMQGIIPFVPVGNVRFVISPTTGLTLTVHTDANGEAIVDGLAPGLYTIQPFFGPDPTEATVAPAGRQVNIALDSSALAEFTVSFPRSIRYRCERWVNGTVPHGPPFACQVSLTAVQVNGITPGTQVAQGQLAGERVGLFTEVVSGTYRVTITPDPAVSGQAGWPVYEELVSLGDGDHREVAYRYNPVGGAVMIWGYAFYDRNQDGSRQNAWNEASDSAANGLTVSLYRLDGSLVMTTTTQPQAQYGPGYYSFAELAPDSYRVEVELGVGQYPTTPQNVERLVDAISPPEPVHFGYIKQFNATVQGQAFYDNNGDGLFNPAVDDPISGATLELADSDGTLINTTASAADGSYSFGGLVTGLYEVTLLPPGDEGQLTRSVAVPAGNSAVTLNYALAPADGRTRALVFLDGNFNGLPDDGEALAGATVLRRHAACQSLSNAQVDSAVSDASGLALFSLIADGPFCLAADPDGLPPGAVLAQHNGVALARGQGLVWIRLLPAGALTILPFWDMDGDFEQDSFEPLVGGADVTIPGEGTIRSSAGAGATFSLSTGSYAVTVEPPANMSVTIIQPQTASLSNGSATSLAIPLRYLGQIQGTVNANGGTPPWSNVTVILENLTSGATATRSVPTASGYFSFQNIPTGSYRLRLQNSPPGWILAHEPVFFYSAGNSLAQALTLIQLESINGLVYTDANGNGQHNSNEAVNGNYDVTLVNSAGLPEQTVDVAADGTFSVDGLVPGVQYAVTIDLGNQTPAAPGIAITQNPGWFVAGSSGGNLAIGIYPYPWEPDNGHFNTVFGRVFEQVGTVKNPHAGAVIGYYRWADNGGCNNNNPIWGTTTTDIDGYYRLLTDFIPSTWEFYCIKVLELPGMVQESIAVTDSAYYYTSTSGLIYYAAVQRRDLVVVPAGTAQSWGSDNAISWQAFRDDNGNGWRDGDEPALPGVTVSSGASQAGSGLDGSGTLTGLSNGQQQLTITPPTGYVPLGPANRTVWLNGAPIDLGQMAFRPVDWFSGSLFNDADGDGWRHPDELGLGGLTLTLTGPAQASVVTAPDGSFAIPGLADGQYTVSVAAPAGWLAPGWQVNLSRGGAASFGLTPTEHVSGAIYEDWDGDGRRLADEPLLTHPLTMTLGTATTNLQAGHFLFWNVSPGSYDLTAAYGAVNGVSVQPQTGGGVAMAAVPAGVVRGTVWHDVNRDGLRQPWETPLAGLTVSLNGETRFTDAQGRYEFVGIPAGSYGLTVDLPAGLEATLPTIVVGPDRGVVAGIPAAPPAGYKLYLPITTRG